MWDSCDPDQSGPQTPLSHSFSLGTRPSENQKEGLGLDIGWGGNVPSGVYGIFNISLYPLYFGTSSRPWAQCGLSCALTTSLASRSHLFSVSLNCTSGLWFVFPANMHMHAIINQHACIPGTRYTSAPAYLPDPLRFF